MAKSKTSKSKKPATTAIARYVTTDDLKDAFLEGIANKVEEDILNNLLGEPNVGLITDRVNLDEFSEDMRGKYPNLFKDVQLSHQYDSDSMEFIVEFYTGKEVDETATARDYVKVADEVATTVLGVSLKTLRQLGIELRLTNTSKGKFIHCAIDSTTRHILLNGMDDPYRPPASVPITIRPPIYNPIAPSTTPTSVSTSWSVTAAPPVLIAPSYLTVGSNRIKLDKDGVWRIDETK